MSGHFEPRSEVSGHFGPESTRHFGPKVRLGFKVASFQHNQEEFIAVARTTCGTSEAQPTVTSDKQSLSTAKPRAMPQYFSFVY